MVDIIIVGGGVAGALLCSRILAGSPETRINILEAEDFLGGRLRKTQGGSWGYGLGRISQSLFDFWNQTVKEDPEALDLPHYSVRSREKLGYLAANVVNSVDWHDGMSRDGAKKLAGAAVARDWGHVEKTFGKSQRSGASQSLGQAWTGDRKSPSAALLEMLALAFGIPDLWNAQLKLLVARLAVDKPAYLGDWQAALEGTLARHVNSSQVQINTSCRVVDARYDKKENLWELRTSKGMFVAPKVVVAVPPWDALGWLPKPLWPAKLLNMVMKSRPVSIVTLTERVVGGNAEELFDTILVPAEKTQVVYDNGEICYQGTLTHELSLSAPAVVKTVRRLKRTRKKYHNYFNGIKTEGEHLALLSTGWAQAISAAELKWFEKLDNKDFQKPHLVFCGDAYGKNTDSDLNLVHSVLSSCERLTNP